MKDFIRNDLLFSLCGLNCGLCPMHLDDHCPGCGGGEGNQSCKMARCSLSHAGVEYCNQCLDFPCERYEGIDEFDSFITHRNRMKDFEKAGQIDMEAYQAEQREKMEILDFLLANCNDGRRKSFFCLTVNLLDLEDLKTVIGNIAEENGLESITLKEKAVYVVKQLLTLAEQRGVVLKLNRKPSKSK
nr:DUF3795 domain-containing protein [uncultured Eisenbergiella sp.]